MFDHRCKTILWGRTYVSHWFVKWSLSFSPPDHKGKKRRKPEEHRLVSNMEKKPGSQIDGEYRLVWTQQQDPKATVSQTLLKRARDLKISAINVSVFSAFPVCMQPPPHDEHHLCSQRMAQACFFLSQFCCKFLTLLFLAFFSQLDFLSFSTSQQPELQFVSQWCVCSCLSLFYSYFLLSPTHGRGICPIFQWKWRKLSHFWKTPRIKNVAWLQSILLHLCIH